jgi:hypothetical protein
MAVLCLDQLAAQTMFMPHLNYLLARYVMRAVE